MVDSQHLQDSADDRKVIEMMLDDNRRALIDRVRGLSESDARRRLVPSLTTAISLIKHAAAAERIWFQRFWSDLDESQCDGYSRRDEGTFVVADGESLDDVIAEFERASRHSREIASRFALAATKNHPVEGNVSMRWTLLVMLQEFARHAGHADILREQIDSSAEAPTGRVEQEILEAYEQMRTTILTRDLDDLIELHDPEFLGTELPGRLITAEEHIQTTMNSRNLEMTFYDIKVKVFGDIVMSWAQQTLHGHLEPDDPGTSPEVADRVEKHGVRWSMLVVWRKTGGRWRMLSYQVTPIS